MNRQTNGESGNTAMTDLRAKSVSVLREIGAYEALWDRDLGIPTFRSIAEKFRQHPNAIPSDFVEDKTAREYAERVLEIIKDADLEKFGARLHGTADYPDQLRDAVHPVELLYFQGYWDLAASNCVAVVGTRKPSDQGIAQTREVVRTLLQENFTIVSGLAAGIDTIAHQTALAGGGRTVGVIGTPLSESYPRENLSLQRNLAKNFLIISQVPFCRYRRQTYRINKFFFPERNITMAALTQATIIIEAGETSGTLVQARAALQQKRKLLILDSCFRDPRLTWPVKFEKKGAIRVSDSDDIMRHLGPDTSSD